MDTHDFDEAAFDRQERLTAYLDDELTPDERAALEDELARDPDLRDELESLRATASALRNLGAPQAPEAFVREVETRIRVRSRGRFFDEDPLYRSRLPYELFAAVLLVMLGALLYYGDPTQRDTDLAMAGREEPASAPPPASAPAPATSEPVLTPARREPLRYRVTLQDPNPRERLDTLEATLRQAGAADLQRRRDGDAETLSATLPEARLEGALRDLGPVLRVERVSSPDAPSLLISVTAP